MAVGKKISPMKYLPLAMAAVGGAAQIYGGIDFGGRRKKAAQDARERLEDQVKAFKDLDTSNIYADVQNLYKENIYEDLTVNQQQAQFEAQQGAQQRANIMQQLSGAAGGSGIAGLAQSMARQGELATQRASVSIGQQEAANQRARAQGKLLSLQGEERARQMRLSGEQASRSLQYQKTQGLLSLAAGEAEATRAALEAGRQQVIGGIGQLGGAVLGGFAAGGGFEEGGFSMGNLREYYRQ